MIGSVSLRQRGFRVLLPPSIACLGQRNVIITTLPTFYQYYSPPTFPDSVIYPTSVAHARQENFIHPTIHTIFRIRYNTRTCSRRSVFHI